MKLLLFFILIAFTPSLFAQDVEYGKPEELKGLTKIFINVGTDLKAHAMIVKEIEKAKLPNVKIMDSADEAEILIFFKSGTTEGTTTANTNEGTTVLNTQTLRTGTASVFIAGKDPKKARLIMSFEATQKGLLLDKPAEKFGKQFVKEYKKANGIK